MAIGDAAIAAGLATVDGSTTEANTIDTEIMQTRDYVADVMGKLPGKITVSTTQPVSPATNDVWVKPIS